MKWVTLICLLLCTLVTESRHLKKRDVDHHSREIGKLYLLLGQTNFKHILLCMVAQTFQKCSTEQHMEEVEEITKFAKHCADHEDEAECKKPMMTTFHDKICAIPNLSDHYSWTTTCCPMAEPDRDKCFHDHRDIEHVAFTIPDAEATCKLHKEHPEDALHNYIDTIAKRHSSILPSGVLNLAEQYNNDITDCCAQEDKQTCFEVKYPGLLKNIHLIENTNKQICRVLAKFPHSYHSLKLAKLSQKHPEADFDVLQKLSSESVTVSKDCCSGDEIECMLERMEFNQHICDNQEKISPSLKACCEKPILEQTPCFKSLSKDPVPEGLPDMKEYLEDEQKCKQFEANPDNFLNKFLYEFSRRHAELHHLSSLRVRNGYKDLLTKCCAGENPVECLKKGNEILEDRIKQNQALLAKNCELLDKVGEAGFIVLKLADYVKKIPEVTDKTLLEIATKMTKIGLKCCALPENQRISCSEGNLDLLLGEMCERLSDASKNKQAHHCCDNVYEDRRPCFTNLVHEPSYTPPAFNEKDFHIGSELCKGLENDQQVNRQLLLIHVLKHKPDIPIENLQGIIGDFTKVRVKCCAVKDPDVCFETERPAIIEHLKKELEH